MENFIEDAQILETGITRDYERFRFHESNRTVETPRLNRMIKLMEQHGGWLVGSIIAIDRKGIIIDGQSRFLAAQVLGNSITFVMFDIDATPEIIRKNNTNRINWTLEDTHKGLVAEGNKNHIELNNFMKKHPELNFTDVTMIAKSSTRSAYRKEIESGEFKIKDMEKSEDWAKKIETFKSFIPKNYNSRGFVRALVKVFVNPTVDCNELMRCVKNHPDELKYFKKMEGNLEMLQTIYNKGKNKKNRNYTITGK